MALQQRQVAGVALIAAGLYVQSQRRARTVVVEAPPRGIARELLRLIDALEDQLRVAMSQTDEVLGAARQALELLTALHGEIMGFAARLADLERQLTEILALIDQAMADADSLEQAIAQALDVTDRLSALVGQDAAPLLAELRALLEQAQARIRELEAALEELRRRIAAALETVQQLLGMVRAILADFEQVIRAIQNLINASQQLRETLQAVINTLSAFAYYLEEVDVRVTVTTGQAAPFHTHAQQTATIQWEVDVWPSLTTCAMAWVEVVANTRTVFYRYNRSCCSLFRCSEACLQTPGCVPSSHGEKVGNTERFTLPGGIGTLRADAEPRNKGYGKATLTFRTIRLFAE